MSYYAQPLTKLEAINICLSSMGEPAINALDDAGVDAQIAADIIDETSRVLQLKGWHWNTEVHTLQPDRQTGAINLPNNVAKIDTVEHSAGVDVVSRGLRLFDRSNNSYSFKDSLRLSLVMILPYEELPLPAKAFVAYQSAMVSQQRLLGSATMDNYLEKQAQSAWVEIVRDNDEVADANMLRDSWSTLSIVQRGHFRRGSYM